MVFPLLLLLLFVVRISHSRYNILHTASRMYGPTEQKKKHYSTQTLMKGLLEASTIFVDLHSRWMLKCNLNPYNMSGIQYVCVCMCERRWMRSQTRARARDNKSKQEEVSHQDVNALGQEAEFDNMQRWNPKSRRAVFFFFSSLSRVRWA